ncbi:MAG TPA: YbhB/YbcL family Raf kinase inhibitor-like protein [Acidimicrobiia bacterium]
MRLWSDSFEDGGWIDPRNAFATAAEEGHVRLSDNVNPHLAWDDVPEGTRSFALLMRDRDAPSSREDANKEDREVPADLPRVYFDHWVVANLPGDLREIREGEFCSGVTPGGKPGGVGPHGCLEGRNDYTMWFDGDPDMGGTYHGYDGPAPPWNDSIPHHYEFTLYALDVDGLDMSGSFTAEDVMKAMEGHVLAEATITGKYTQNPRLLPA